MLDRAPILVFVWVAVAACGSTPRITTAPSRPPRAAQAPRDEWPVPVRILVRDPSGEVSVHGTLPPPPGRQAALPEGDRWFVEPIDLDLSDWELGALIVEVVRHRVPGLSLRGDRRIGDRQVARLAILRHLRVLDLTGTRVSGVGLAALDGNLSQLRGLYLGGTQVSDDSLVAVAANFRGLQAIDLEGCAITDAGVRILADLPLRQIGLASTGITDKGADALRAHAQHLTSLDLGETNVGDAGLSWLADARSLVHLGLWRTQVTNRFLPQLALAKQLAVLDLSETSVDDAGLTTLDKSGVLARLTSLDLSTTKVTDRGAILLGRAMQLESLDLGGTLIGDRGAGARVLSGLIWLRFLSLRKTKTDEYDIAKLVNLTAIRHLDLGETRVTSDVVPHLDKMTELVELYLDTTSIEDQAVEQIAARHPNLRVFHLDDNALGERAARALMRLTGLVELTIGETELPEAHVASIVAALPSLEVLDLSSLKLSDAIAPALARLEQLHTLDLSKNRISDRGLAALQPLQRLRVLGLQSTDVTLTRDAILAAFPGLRDLVTD